MFPTPDLGVVDFFFFSYYFQLKLNIVVVLTNVNDNPPVFGQKLYHLDVTEVSV